jgi:putative photosynthetic complex assembly protein 2
MADLTESLVAPALFALLCWWFGTGLILWLVRRPLPSFRWSLAGFTVLLVASLWTTWLSMQAHTVANAYLAFASVIAMWSWHELAFLTGWLAGPRKTRLPPGASGWSRFTQSLQAVLWHELALLANFAALWWMQQGQPSHLAICTFALLWCMRASAKLNLFFGVPEVGEQYLPRHLAYLGSYFRRGPVGLFFYATVGAACLVWAWVVWQIPGGETARNTGWVLLAALLGLAIVEHAIMAWPLPLQKLWGWAMSQRPHKPFTDRRDVQVISPSNRPAIKPD